MEDQEILHTRYLVRDIDLDVVVVFRLELDATIVVHVEVVRGLHTMVDADHIGVSMVEFGASAL